GREVPPHSARVVLLDDVHGVGGDVDGHVSLALFRRFRRGADVHRQVAYGAAVSELDLGVSPADAWEPIDAIDDDLVAATTHTLHRNRVVTELGEETVSLFRLGGAAADDRQRGE